MPISELTEEKGGTGGWRYGHLLSTFAAASFKLCLRLGSAAGELLLYISVNTKTSLLLLISKARSTAHLNSTSTIRKDPHKHPHPRKKKKLHCLPALGRTFVHNRDELILSHPKRTGFQRLRPVLKLDCARKYSAGPYPCLRVENRRCSLKYSLAPAHCLPTPCLSSRKWQIY